MNSKSRYKLYIGNVKIFYNVDKLIITIISLKTFDINHN